VAPRELSLAERRLPLLGVYEPSFACVNIVGKVAGWFDARICASSSGRPCYARREKNKKAPSHIAVGGAVDAARETLSGFSSQAEKPATKEAEGVAKEEESGAVHEL
jgi:hypothetical protein